MPIFIDKTVPSYSTTLQLLALIEVRLLVEAGILALLLGRLTIFAEVISARAWESKVAREWNRDCPWNANQPPFDATPFLVYISASYSSWRLRRALLPSSARTPAQGVRCTFHTFFWADWESAPRMYASRLLIWSTVHIVHSGHHNYGAILARLSSDWSHIWVRTTFTECPAWSLCGVPFDPNPIGRGGVFLV